MEDDYIEDDYEEEKEQIENNQKNFKKDLTKQNQLYIIFQQPQTVGICFYP